MLRDYSRKKHFVFLGNMSHAPNYDGVRYLVEKIWPAINVQIIYILIERATKYRTAYLWNKSS
jgi:hypothetical protein